jgi:alpha-galactosidase
MRVILKPGGLATILLAFLMLVGVIVWLSTLRSRAASDSAPAIVNDSDPTIHFDGAGWRGSTGRAKGDYGDDVHWTDGEGDSMSYTFTGTGVDVVTETNEDEGDVQIFLDDAVRTTVSAYSATRAMRVTLFKVSDLPNARHTIKCVKRSGTYMLLDAFRIYP